MRYYHNPIQQQGGGGGNLGVGKRRDVRDVILFYPSDVIRSVVTDTWSVKIFTAKL